MTRQIEEPMAVARIRWRTPSEGGRSSGPPPGPTYAPTAVFTTGDDAAVIPDWPQGAEQFSVLLEFSSVEHGDEVVAKVDFFARDLVEDRVREGARLLIMEGSRVVGDAEIIQRLLP